MMKRLADAIAKRDRLEKELAKADARLSPLLLQFAERGGTTRSGKPRLDVVRCQLRNAGMLK